MKCFITHLNSDAGRHRNISTLWNFCIRWSHQSESCGCSASNYIQAIHIAIIHLNLAGHKAVFNVDAYSTASVNRWKFDTTQILSTFNVMIVVGIDTIEFFLGIQSRMHVCCHDVLLLLLRTIVQNNDINLVWLMIFGEWISTFNSLHSNLLLMFSP